VHQHALDSTSDLYYLFILQFMASTMGNAMQPQPVNLKDLSHLAGRWVGIYGPHGLETIDVKVTDGSLVAIKVSGDPNVPSGTCLRILLKFRALLISKQQLIHNKQPHYKV
jgi:hypothetical protein